VLFNCPLSAEKAQRMISLFDLPSNAQVLDIGCGSGEFLLRVLETYTSAIGLGVDKQESCIAQAQARQAGRVSPERCSFEALDIQALPLTANGQALLICMGASQAFGSGDAAYTHLLAQSLHILRPGGLVLIGEGYWKDTPSREYLHLIGEPTGIYRDHKGNIILAEEAGLIPLYATTSNSDEWDDFEWSHRMRIEKAAAQAPEDPEMREKREQSRIWRNGYLRWGRNTMGFGFYLFQKPTEPV
jgi:SAM-dependent methyltransferase